MTETELKVILGKASLRYPNLAPNFNEQPMIFNEYLEELRNVSFDDALLNLKEHTRKSEFFPSIAALCKKRERGPYDGWIEDTRLRLSQPIEYEPVPDWVQEWKVKMGWTQPKK